MTTYSFLIHQSLVRTVIYDTFAENGCRELAVDILGIQIGVFPIEDEVVPLRAKEDGGGFPKENECEAVAVFGPTIKEELVRVYAVLNCAADPWEYVEHYWWVVRVWETELVQHILGNGTKDDENDGNENGIGKR